MRFSSSEGAAATASKPGRQIVTFLLVCNLGLWITYNFEMQKVRDERALCGALHTLTYKGENFAAAKTNDRGLRKALRPAAAVARMKKTLLSSADRNTAFII